MSHHDSTWLGEQGHAPCARSVLGAVALATERVGLMTYLPDRASPPPVAG